MRNTAGLLVGLALWLSAAAVPAETLHLFDGQSLDGWYTFLKDRGRDTDPNNVFTVTDGVIRISGEEWGCITTDAEFENYHLIVEFKWGEITHAPRVENSRDSGVLIHSQGEDGAYSGTWMHAIEVQIIEGGTGDLLAVGDGTDKLALTCSVAPEKQGGSYLYSPDGEPATIHGGRINWWGRDPDWADVKGFRGRQDVENPVGEWNRLECIVDNGKVTVILNGTVVNRALGTKPRMGRIQIQSEGAEIFVRKVDLSR